MKRVFKIFKVSGIPVRIDISWFLILVLVAWTLSAHWYPSIDALKEYSLAVHWSMGIVSALLLFASVLLHEMMHSLVGLRENLPIRSITLFMFGGVADIGEEPQTPGAELRMALAGPATTLVLAGIFFGAFIASDFAGLPPYVVEVLRYLTLINVILLAFNMVPGFPLDGGRVLRAVLWSFMSLRKATRIASYVGSAFGIFLVVLGIMGVIRGAIIGGFWFIIIGLFLRSAAEQSYRSVLFKGALEGIRVSEIMTENPITVDVDLTVHELVEEFFYRKRFHSFPVVEAGRTVGFIYIGEVKSIPREKWDQTRVRDVMDTEIMDLALHPDDDAIKALNAMLHSGKGRIPIVEDERLVGLVSRQDIINYLNIRMDLE